MKACECTNIAGKSAERVERATKTSERYVCESGEYTTRARAWSRGGGVDFDVLETARANSQATRWTD